MKERDGGFSLIEVVLAIGVVAFALLSVMALLPIGIKSNQVSMEETRALGMLTLLEADLRNTWPGKESSNIYGLPLPFRAGAGGYEAVTGWHTVGLANDERAAGLAARPRFQLSVVYRESSADGEAVDARLIVNWPGLDTTRPEDLSNPLKVGGYVEVFTKFRKPN